MDDQDVNPLNRYGQKNQLVANVCLETKVGSANKLSTLILKGIKCNIPYNVYHTTILIVIVPDNVVYREVRW